MRSRSCLCAFAMNSRHIRPVTGALAVSTSYATSLATFADMRWARVSGTGPRRLTIGVPNSAWHTVWELSGVPPAMPCDMVATRHTARQPDPRGSWSGSTMVLNRSTSAGCGFLSESRSSCRQGSQQHQETDDTHGEPSLEMCHQLRSSANRACWRVPLPGNVTGRPMSGRARSPKAGSSFW